MDHPASSRPTSRRSPAVPPADVAALVQDFATQRLGLARNQPRQRFLRTTAARVDLWRRRVDQAARTLDTVIQQLHAATRDADAMLRPSWDNAHVFGERRVESADVTLTPDAVHTWDGYLRAQVEDVRRQVTDAIDRWEHSRQRGRRRPSLDDHAMVREADVLLALVAAGFTKTGASRYMAEAVEAVWSRYDTGRQALTPSEFRDLWGGVYLTRKTSREKRRKILANRYRQHLLRLGRRTK